MLCEVVSIISAKEGCHILYHVKEANKQKNTNITTNRKGGETGEQTITCAVQVQVKTKSLINLHNVYSLV